LLKGHHAHFNLVVADSSKASIRTDKICLILEVAGRDVSLLQFVFVSPKKVWCGAALK
jgi:tRNA threonylcarbamoyladenosine modification (KEOPS) complex  Pcc1 subunit